MSTTANGCQVGGTHYKNEVGEQHWDRMWRLYREAWFVGNITKYTERYRSKNGVEDLRKARHYLDKLIELEEAEAPVDPYTKRAINRLHGDDPHDA